MAPKTGSDLEEIRALLAEVKALREDVELKGAELRSSWGVDADKSKVPPRVLNLSHYIALRAHDVTDLQYRLAARGLSSLGRSESHVAQALDALIATLKRLSGEPSAPYPAPVLARAGAAELEAEADRLFGKRQKGGPRARVMATLPPEAATEAAVGRQSGSRRHGLRAHQLRPRRPRNVGANDRECASGRPRGSSVPAGC